MIPERRAFGGWSLGRLLRVGLIAVGVSLLSLIVFYVVVRLRVMSDLQAEFAALHAEHMATQETYLAKIADLEYRANETEKLLYGDVLAKLQAKTRPTTPARVEVWVTKEIRERVSKLERRMMDVEQEIR